MVYPIFITGNQHKADRLAEWLKLPIEHQKLDLDEIQSLDPYEVVTHKVNQAYSMLQKPVLVEDVSLIFTAMGRLPGTLIKWFLDELGTEQLTKLASQQEHPGAVAGIIYALHDGHKVHYFEETQPGTIAPAPRGTSGFGWNPLFIPDGSKLTYAEMDEATFKQWNIRAHAIEQLRLHLAAD